MVNNIVILVYVIALVGSIYLSRKELGRVATGQTSEENLSKKEKLIIWLLCIFNPILAGAIFYYSWKKRVPIKAKQANSISLSAFLILMIISAFIHFSTYKNSSFDKVSLPFITKYNEIMVLEKDIYNLSLLVQKDTQEGTNDINQELRLIKEASLKQNETISDLELVIVKTDELKNTTNNIVDTTTRNNASNMINFLEKRNLIYMDYLKLQKVLIDKMLDYYQLIKDNKSANSPDVANLETQIQNKGEEFKNVDVQYTNARDEFLKEAGLPNI